jgi:hypothetical protein
MRKEVMGEGSKEKRLRVNAEGRRDTEVTEKSRKGLQNLAVGAGRQLDLRRDVTYLT